MMKVAVVFYIAIQQRKPGLLARDHSGFRELNTNEKGKNPKM